MVDEDLGDELNKFKELQKKEAVEWKNKGNDYFKKGDYENAIQNYKNALDIEPNYSDAWNNLGLAYMKTGNIEMAKKCKDSMDLLKKGNDLKPPSTTSTEIDVKIPPEPLKKSDIDRRPFWLGIFGGIIGILVGLVGLFFVALVSYSRSHDTATIFGLPLYAMTLATFIFTITGMVSGIFGNTKKWGILMACCGIIILFTTYFVGILATIFFVIGGIILYKNEK
jgi:tetratricopeptide (TPR) repeat protein